MTLSPEAPDSTPARHRQSLRRAQAALIVWALVPVLMLAALAAYTLGASRAQHVQRAEALSQNLASALARGVSADIYRIDATLSSIVDLSQQSLRSGKLDTAMVAALVDAHVRRHPELDGIRITDADGVTVVGSNIPGQPPLSMADRDWFQFQRSNTANDLFMSQPLQRKVNGQWVVSLSRRYVDAQGQFAGAVSAAVSLAYFDRQLQAVDAGATAS